MRQLPVAFSPVDQSVGAIEKLSYIATNIFLESELPTRMKVSVAAEIKHTVVKYCQLPFIPKYKLFEFFSRYLAHIPFEAHLSPSIFVPT